jgi:hypothetical protein
MISRCMSVARSTPAGRFFFCDPANVGVLGYEHGNPDQPVVCLWNCSSQSRE